MTENERRALDRVTKRDLMLRGMTVIGLIVAALILLLMVQPG